MTHVCMQRGCVCYVCCFAGGAGMAFECLVSYLGFQKTVCHGKVRASWRCLAGENPGVGRSRPWLPLRWNAHIYSCIVPALLMAILARQQDFWLAMVVGTNCFLPGCQNKVLMEMQFVGNPGMSLSSYDFVGNILELWPGKGVCADFGKYFVCFRVQREQAGTPNDRPHAHCTDPWKHLKWLQSAAGWRWIAVQLHASWCTCSCSPGIDAAVLRAGYCRLDQGGLFQNTSCPKARALPEQRNLVVTC